MRCKEHFQGDRCRKDAHHDSKLAEKPDPEHVGAFSSWEGTGDSQKKIMQSQAPILKRDRILERFMANPLAFPRVNRKGIIQKLREYAAYQSINKGQTV
jgi:hypothetical protein